MVCSTQAPRLAKVRGAFFRINASYATISMGHPCPILGVASLVGASRDVVMARRVREKSAKFAANAFLLKAREEAFDDALLSGKYGDVCSGN